MDTFGKLSKQFQEHWKKQAEAEKQQQLKKQAKKGKKKKKKPS